MAIDSEATPSLPIQVGNRIALEIIDGFLDEHRNQTIVPMSEVVNLVLDIRNSLQPLPLMENQLNELSIDPT